MATVNGVRYGWSSITIDTPHGEMGDATAISYDSTSEKEALYGKGRHPVGYGKKNCSATGKLTVRREVLDEWEKAEGKSILELEPFPITVSYAEEGKATVTDELRQCLFTNKAGMGASQGDADVTVDLDFLILGGIKYNGMEEK